MSTCCLCSNLVCVRSDEFWNKPLFESTNFVVLPSLGSLVEGWLLIVPRNHYVSMGALPAHLANEMEQVKIDVTTAIGPRYGKLCAFEHGPSRAGHKIGCGVDHAHLHIVPINFDLALAATPLMPPGATWVSATLDSCRIAFNRGQDYLYLEQPIGHGRIATNGDFGSQVFRKAIAAQVGKPEQFSWQDYPQKEAVARTIHALSNDVEISA